MKTGSIVIRPTAIIVWNHGVLEKLAYPETVNSS